MPVRLLGPCFKTGRKCAQQKSADPVHLRGDPAFLDRTSERALRTVPVRRTSGSPAALALKDRSPGRCVTWSSSLDLATDADGETIRSLPASRQSYPSSPRPLGRSAVGRQPQRRGRNARERRHIDPPRQGSPERESADGAGRRSLPLH